MGHACAVAAMSPYASPRPSSFFVSAVALAVAVGAAGSESAGFARRISYLVGPDGKVRKAYDDVDPSAHAAGVLADCAAAPGPKP